MRLIDADAPMEKLNGIWDCNNMTFAPVDGCCIDADCKSCRWRETIEYVKRLVQNQTTISPWHMVEEPPKENGRYLVYMFTSDWRWEFKFASYLHDRWIGTGGGDVRYWMPIEPPKEEA